MNFFGLNRVALNNGVATLVAGAALLVSSGDFAAAGTRNAMSAAAAAGTASFEATGVRTVFGAGVLAGASGGSASPSTVQLQSANFVAVSWFVATYTMARSGAVAGFQADGFITRPGTGVASAASTGTANPLVTVGYTSDLTVASAMMADASVKLNGQSTTQRDGYAQVATTVSTLAAGAVRTALAQANALAFSTCATDSIKVHGGAASFDSVCSISVIAAVDLASATTVSLMLANGFVTCFGEAPFFVTSMVMADQAVVITSRPLDRAESVSSLTAAGRLALLGGGAFNVTTVVSASARLAILGAAGTASEATLAADGAIYQLAAADFSGLATVSASWSVLRPGGATVAASATLTADAFTNIEVPDPSARVLSRPFTDRELRRPFVERELKRAA